jgi:hypothetical protein
VIAIASLILFALGANAISNSEKVGLISFIKFVGLLIFVVDDLSS